MASDRRNKNKVYIENLIQAFITVRNSSCGKVIFSQACVKKKSVHREGVFAHCMLRYTHPTGRQPARQTTSLGRHPLHRHPSGQTPPGRHPPTDNPSPPPRWPLQQTVRILLECILVYLESRLVLWVEIMGERRRLMSHKET